MEAFKTIPPIYDFILRIETSEEKVKGQELSDLIDFSRKMNIHNSFKQMPGIPIKLNIPIQLKQVETKSKKRSKLNLNVTKDPGSTTKSKVPDVGSLLGNHEIMNVEGDFKYTSNANINMFKTYHDPILKKKLTGNAVENRTEAFYNGKEYANLLGCTRQSVLIIGEFLFVHAGITNYVLNNFPGRENLPKLNDMVKQWLLQQMHK